MKLWQKVYLTTLAVALLITNVGIYLVFYSTYQQNLEQEKTRAKIQSRLIYTTLNSSLKSNEQMGGLDEISARYVGRIYGVFYNGQGINIQIWKDGKCVYSPNAEITWGDLQYDEEKESVVLFTKNGEKYVIVTRRFDTKGEYVFSYQQPITELEQGWERLILFYIGMSLAISLLLAMVLGVLLRRLMMPVKVLTDAVVEMQQGNYESRVVPKGKDDIAQLGMRFNEMADTICASMEEIQQENEAKQRFVDNFSHEMKSPLTSIYGFAEYLQKSNAPREELVECLGYIMEESERLKKMSHVLMEMDRLQTNGSNLEVGHCDCESIRETVEQELHLDLERRAVELEWNIQCSSVLGNKMLLEVLLTNLTRNSIRACSSDGRIVITVEENLLRVQDNGCGMSKEHVKHAMEPFYRVDKARSRQDGGNGLGLALCRQIAEVHGGKLMMESEVGVGTAVTVVFTRDAQ